MDKGAVVRYSGLTPALTPALTRMLSPGQVDEARLAAAAAEYLGRFLAAGRRCAAVVCGDERRAAEVAGGVAGALGVSPRVVRLRDLVPAGPAR